MKTKIVKEWIKFMIKILLWLAKLKCFLTYLTMFCNDNLSDHSTEHWYTDDFYKNSKGGVFNLSKIAFNFVILIALNLKISNLWLLIWLRLYLNKRNFLAMKSYNLSIFWQGFCMNSEYSILQGGYGYVCRQNNCLTFGIPNRVGGNWDTEG